MNSRYEVRQAARRRAWSVGAWVAVAVAPALSAGTFSIRPIEFGDGIVATGTLTTAGAGAPITDWNLRVETRELLARYTKGNTASAEVTQVSAGGAGITVGTVVDPANNPGGVLRFRSPNPFNDFGVTLADFNVVGGEASYMVGGNSDLHPLAHPAPADFVSATRRTPGGTLFDLVPLHFAGGVTLSGTLTTDGTLGPLQAANLLSWDLRLEQVTLDLFEPGNSAVQATGLGLSADAQDLTLTIPDGSLRFSKGALGGHAYALQLADFTDPNVPGGQAGYFQGRQAVHTVDLGAGQGPWMLTGTAPIAAADDDVSLLLLGGGLLGTVGLRARVVRSRAAAVR